MSEAAENLLVFPSDSDEPIKAEIILYQFDNANVPVEVRYLNETFWLTQEEMAALFDTSPSNISMHLKNIFEEGELIQEDSLIKFRISEFNKKPTNFYNLDAAIAVGYRVNSLRATRFRQWATATLSKPKRKPMKSSGSSRRFRTQASRTISNGALTRVASNSEARLLSGHHSCGVGAG